MPAPRFRLTPLSVLLLLGAFAALPARAGLFDDDEARKQVTDLSAKTNERVDTLSKAQIDLSNQIQSLREENAKLHGQIETLTYELDSAKKRQQDFYIDLDSRLRKIEAGPAAAPPPGGAAQASGNDGAGAEPKKPADPAAESREYEAALNMLKANKLKEAASAFDAFAKAYPDSTLTPNAYYWQGNALSSLRDCKKAIDVYRIVVGKWPQNPKAPDSLVSMAFCQQELGDAKGARASLETVLAKYPDSSAASTARQRLKK